ncbi:glycosyltransferase family 9 protein [Rhodocyclus tenuis]|uniref:Glycosyltransferase family 9 protein n=1 Tax=Rhodocyclus gracilis TaxID=2929842 RepID=A0ABX0WJT0_9RHOO|nr:glycosyltransferase family 9 protein [Rhodocyclus gracilis]NJA89981.1 glycosyltransferase family 9 protein [Rhodocyclus gracilis]
MNNIHQIRRILVIRRDNIGDLVCTTPFIHSIRQHFPDAELSTLVNSYNRATLDKNPDIDYLFSYEKLKHSSGAVEKLSAVSNRIALIAKMRRCRFDLAVLAKPGFDPHGLRMARLAGAERVLGFAPKHGEHCRGLTDSLVDDCSGLHEVEAIALIGKKLGITTAPGRLRVFPDVRLSSLARQKLESEGKNTRWIALHISAREATRRWPLEKFISLIERLSSIPNLGFAVFWSPGSVDSPTHPGDDEKAAALLQRTAGKRVVAMPTSKLEDLIAGVAACDFFLGADGGAMHVAAGLERPIVALFENSTSKRTHWYPWQVRHILLQPQTFAVEDIEVEAVAQAVDEIVGDSGRTKGQFPVA